MIVQSFSNMLLPNVLQISINLSFLGDIWPNNYRIKIFRQLFLRSNLASLHISFNKRIATQLNNYLYLLQMLLRGLMRLKSSFRSSVASTRSSVKCRPTRRLSWTGCVTGSRSHRTTNTTAWRATDCSSTVSQSRTTESTSVEQ